MLREKDEKLTDFISRFDSSRSVELAQHHELQQSIVHLLQVVSDDANRKAHLPSRDRVSEIKEELQFKEKQLLNSRTTEERLKHDLELRKQELEKVKSLEAKIASETDALRSKMDK